MEIDFSAKLETTAKVVKVATKMKLTNQDANITFRYSMLIKIRVLQRRNKINYCVCQ